MSYYSYLNSSLLKTFYRRNKEKFRFIYLFLISIFFLSPRFGINVPFLLVVKCPAITTSTHGEIFPTQCNIASGVNYGTHCSFMCNVSFGYRLQGPRNVSCRENGSWSADATKIICKGRKITVCLAFSGSADGQ